MNNYDVIINPSFAPTGILLNEADMAHSRCHRGIRPMTALVLGASSSPASFILGMPELLRRKLNDDWRRGCGMMVLDRWQFLRFVRVKFRHLFFQHERDQRLSLWKCDRWFENTRCLCLLRHHRPVKSFAIVCGGSIRDCFAGRHRDIGGNRDPILKIG
jgi:hypothetical protein